MKQQNRLLSLDILRGITIAGMLLVNNPGSWGHIYAPLRHAKWNGLTPTDLIFPSFMFIMGISTFLSLKKYHFTLSKASFLKITKRTIVIWGIGLFLSWFSLSIRRWNSLAVEELGFFERFFTSINNFDSVRILGVMPRLAICYFFTAMITTNIKHKYLPYIIGILLVIYSAIILIGNGYAYNETNILSVVDRFILGKKHMYSDNGIEPEGILSTIPAIAQVLLGFVVGRTFISKKDIYKKIELLFIIGALLTFSGFLLSYGLPINKKIWSPTFVLTTCGLTSTLLGLLIWIIDIKGLNRWCKFFEVFGINPLFIFVMGTAMTIITVFVRFPIGEKMISIHNVIYSNILLNIFSPINASLIYALLFVSVNWFIGKILYNRKIYIKI